MSRACRIAAGLAFLAHALLAAIGARAAGLVIDPVRIDWSPVEKSAAIKIKNTSDQPTTVHIEAQSWSQHRGTDIYSPTRDLLVSPRLVTIAPNSEQIVRTILRRQPAAGIELSYRIHFQQQLPPPATGLPGRAPAIRLGLPVFVQAKNGADAPRLAWSATQMPDLRLRIVLHNSGNTHVQVTDFALYVLGEPHPVAGESVSTYILAEQSREWLLRLDTPEVMTAKRFRIKAYTDTGLVESEMPLGAPD